MRRKFVLLGVAVAVVSAFALPATASALEWRDVDGKVGLAKELTHMSHDTKITNTIFGDIICETVDFQSRVSINGPSQLTAVGTASQVLDCIADDFSVEVTDAQLEHLNTVGNDLGSTTVSLVVDVDPFECPYEGELAFTYGTGSGNDVLTVLGTMTSPFEFCEPEDPPVIFEGHYTLTTVSDGKPVFAL